MLHLLSGGPDPCVGTHFPFPWTSHPKGRLLAAREKLGQGNQAVGLYSDFQGPVVLAMALSCPLLILSLCLPSSLSFLFLTLQPPPVLPRPQAQAGDGRCPLWLKACSPPHTVAAGSRSPGPGPPRWPPGLTCGRRRSPRPGKVGSGFELRGPPGIITSNSSLFSPMAWRWGRGTSQWSSSLPIARPSALPWRFVPVYSPSENKPLEPWRRTQHFSPHVRPFPSHPALLLTLPCTRKPADRRTLVQPP